MLKVTRSKGRGTYIRYMFSSSGNSAKHGPHQVAHKLTSIIFSLAFLRSDFKPSAFTDFTFTVWASISAKSSFLPSSLYIHLVEQPTEGVFATFTGLPPRRASIAFLASRAVTKFSRGLLSTLPS